MSTRLQALADDQIGPAHRREVEEHLEGCTTCSQAASEARQNVSFLAERLAHLREAVTTDLSGLAAPAAPPPPKSTVTAKRTNHLPLVIIAAVVIVGLAVAAYFLFVKSDGAREDPTDQGRAVPTGTKKQAKRKPDRPGPAATSRTEPEPETAASRTPKYPNKTVKPAPLGIAAVLPVLMNRPTQRNLERAWTALAANPGYTPRMITRIENLEDPAGRAVLVLVLGADNGSGETRNTLFRILAEDGTPEVRIAAGAALAYSTTDRAVPIPVFRSLEVPVGLVEDQTALKRLLTAAEAERDPTVLATLIRAVGASEGQGSEISTRLAELARSESAVVRNAAVQALKTSPPDDSRVLLRLIEDTSLPIASRAELIEGLAKSRSAVTQLSAIIRGAEEIPLRVAAVGALAKCWDKYARIELLETVRSSSTREVRRAAVGVLSTAPNKVTLEVLNRVAREDEDPGTRHDARQAALEMGRMLSPEPGSDSGD